MFKIGDMIDIGDKVHVTLYMDKEVERGFDAFVSDKVDDNWILIDTDGNIRYVKNYVQIIKYDTKL